MGFYEVMWWFDVLQDRLGRRSIKYKAKTTAADIAKKIREEYRRDEKSGLYVPK